MGMFDNVVIPCPKCAYPVIYQSKWSNNPDLSIYFYPDVPKEVLLGIEYGSKCDACESWLRPLVSRNGKKCAVYLDCDEFDRLILASKDG